MNLDKRKRIVLTIEQKANIVMRLRRGESMRNIMDEFKIGKSTVYDLKRDADKILHFAAESDSMAGPSHRRTMKKSQLNDLDEAVYQWFSQRRSEGLPVSGTLIMEKAMQLYRAMKIDKPFTASTGWLKRFKSRHGIRQSSGRSLSIDNSAKEIYREEFRKIMEEKTSSEQAGSAEEAGRFWQSLLSRTFAYCQETPEDWEEIQQATLQHSYDRPWNNSDNSEDCSESSPDEHSLVKVEICEDIVNSEYETDNHCKGAKQSQNCLEYEKNTLEQKSTRSLSEPEEDHKSITVNLSSAVYHATKLLKFLEKQAETDPLPYLQVVRIRNSIIQQRAKHLRLKEQDKG